ncbi:MAG: hypothetical protein CMM49_01020 [Rhodospirillaceae bacterium]|nr:hypothetical protein [Rhodospirillaceae bacterium]
MKEFNRKVESKFLLNERGFKQHYLDWKGVNNPIVLIHPKRSNCHHWDHMVDSLSISNRVLSPDLRGHGLSDYPDKGYSVPELSLDIIYFIQAKNISKCFIIGCATGGNIAIWIAANYPEIVDGIGIIDPGLSVPKKIADEVKRQTIEEHEFDSYEEAKSSIYFQELWSEEVKNHYAKYSFKKTSNGKWKWLYAAEPAREISESLNNDSVWGISKEVKCKALILRGETSPVFTMEHMNRLGEYINKSIQVNLPNSSHTPAQENPVGLALEIDKFCT